MNCRQCIGLEQVFGDRTAARALERYRRRGPSRTTRMLLQAIGGGVRGSTLVDVGGGVGAVAHALLEGGAAATTMVDASGAYLAAARAEGERRGHADRMVFLHGDFVELAGRVPTADIVTLDRVICCYPDMEALLGAAAQTAGRALGLVYPRDVWWTRVGMQVGNLLLAIARSDFRGFVHSRAGVEGVLGDAGMVCAYRRESGPWQVELYRRD